MTTSRRRTSRRFRPNALREHTLYTIHTVYETPSGETKTSRDTWLAKFGKPTNANLAKIASRFSEGRVISAEIVKLNGDVLASWSAMRRNSRRLRRNSRRRASRRVHHTALTQSVLDRAEKMGTQGFHNGERAPAQSVALHNLTFVEHSGLGARDVMALMDAYNRGWHREQRAAADDALREINFPLPRLYKNARRRTSLRRNEQDETREIKVYYEIVTPESAEEGDVAERGEDEPIVLTRDDLDEDEPSWVDAAVRAISYNAGALEADTYGRGAVPSWFVEIDGSTDYRTGENTRRSFHPRGFSRDEMIEMGRRLTGRR